MILSNFFCSTLIRGWHAKKLFDKKASADGSFTKATNRKREIKIKMKFDFNWTAGRFCCGNDFPVTLIPLNIWPESSALKTTTRVI